MAAFGDATRTIHDSERWEDWEKVVIRSLTRGTQREFIHEIQRNKKDKSPDGITVKDGITHEDMALESCIESWTFTVDGKQDGKKAPITEEWFDKLPGNYSDFILEAIKNFTPDRDTDFLEASRNGSEGRKGDK